MHLRSSILNVMTNAARKAARGLRRDFGEVEQLQVSKKGTADFVTEADLRSERTLHEELAHARPDYGFLMEETGEIEGDDPHHRWIVDPLDGTSNFIHAVPYFCISIGLEKRIGKDKTEIIAAVVYDPLRDEIFYAEKGQGAFLNDRRIAVSARTRLSESMLTTTVPKKNHECFKVSHPAFAKAVDADLSIRANGAAALDLAYIAAGRFDGGWYHCLKTWDIAAGMLLIQESRGMITSVDQKSTPLQSTSVLATNGHIHNELFKLIN
jgi:myo-inositol-1(or 4)-monophosphatase